LKYGTVGHKEGSKRRQAAQKEGTTESTDKEMGMLSGKSGKRKSRSQKEEGE